MKGTTETKPDYATMPVDDLPFGRHPSAASIMGLAYDDVLKLTTDEKILIGNRIWNAAMDDAAAAGYSIARGDVAKNAARLLAPGIAARRSGAR